MDPFSERFEELRAAYRVRLAADLAKLGDLADRLARPDAMQQGQAALIDEIRHLAHRMAGAAGMFKAPAIARAAELLEDASRDASAQVSQAGLKQALEDLMTQIERFGAA